MKEKVQAPELRFDGFTDGWEQRLFADFIDVKSGKDYKHLNSVFEKKKTKNQPYLLKAPFLTVDTFFYAVPKQNIDLQFSLSIF